LQQNFSGEAQAITEKRTANCRW